MNPLAFPWLEASLAAPLLGLAPLAIARRPERAFLAALVASGVALLCATLWRRPRRGGP